MDSQTRTVTLFLGDGAGGFGGPASVVQLHDGLLSGTTALGDVNDDGRADLLYQGHHSDDAVSGYFVHLAGVAAPGFLPPERYADGSLAGAYVAETLLLRDLDGDGDLDLAASGNDDPNGKAAVSVALNDGAGAISSASVH